LGPAAVQAVLESVLRCERSHSPTISAVAVGRRARVTIESTAEPFEPAERERLLDPLRLRNPDELGGGLAFSACAEIVRRAGGNFSLGGDQRRSYSIELPLVGAGRPPTA
ncbi:MAG: ATP-binding protein, partial [Candidatus Binatia bacterium]